MERAESAEQNAQSALENARRIEENVGALSEGLRQAILVVVGATWLQVETKHEFGGGRAAKAMNEIIKDLNAALRYALPDDQARAVWVADLRMRLPPPDGQ